MRPWLIMPLGLVLGAAAAPPSDCGRGVSAAEAFPGMQDLSGRPSAPTGLIGRSFAALPNQETASGCQSPLPAFATPLHIDNDSADALHSLPVPDIVLPINRPKRTPYFP